MLLIVLLLICLSVAVKTENATAICDVLDPNTKFSLPLNLTIKPYLTRWRLNLKFDEIITIHIQRLRYDLHIKYFSFDKMSYEYLGFVIQPYSWNSLAIGYENGKVYIKNNFLDPSHLSNVNGGNVEISAHGMEFAAGCLHNCPQYYISTNKTLTKKTILKSCKDSKIFYFFPYNTEQHMQLEYEVIGISPLGHITIQHIATIHYSSVKWHVVELYHDNGVINMYYNHALYKTIVLQDCTFSKHIIKLKGSGKFSFSCNPLNGKMWGPINEICDSDNEKYYECQNKTSAFPWILSTIILIFICGGILIFVCCRCRVKN